MKLDKSRPNEDGFYWFVGRVKEQRCGNVIFDKPIVVEIITEDRGDKITKFSGLWCETTRYAGGRPISDYVEYFVGTWSDKLECEVD